MNKNCINLKINELNNKLKDEIKRKKIFNSFILKDFLNSKYKFSDLNNTIRKKIKLDKIPFKIINYNNLKIKDNERN